MRTIKFIAACALCIAFHIVSFSQEIQFFGGANYNVFYDFGEENPHNSTSYQSEYGYSTGVSFENFIFEGKHHRFSLQFDHYKGDVEAYAGGLGSTGTTRLRIQKSIVSLGIFPFNFKLVKRIDLNLGVALSFLLSESFSGTYSTWSMASPPTQFNLNERYNQYSRKFTAGLEGRIAYDIPLSSSIFLTPQYIYFLGLTNEFIEPPDNTKSQRHYLCIGIKKKICKEKPVR